MALENGASVFSRVASHTCRHIRYTYKMDDKMDKHGSSVVTAHLGAH